MTMAASFHNGDRGDILSFSLPEWKAKAIGTLGVKIDFSYHIPTNTSATVQWLAGDCDKVLSGLRYWAELHDTEMTTLVAFSQVGQVQTPQMSPITLCRFLGASLKTLPDGYWSHLTSQVRFET